MNAASLQKSASVPATATTAGAAPQGASSSGGVTPVEGQGFVPASGGSSASAASGNGETGAAADGSLPAEQALKALTQVLGSEYGEPILGADGTVYMEKKKPDVKNGSLALSYIAVGKIDKATGRMKINPEILEKVKAKAASAESQKVLVKIGDQMVWQTLAKDENGKPVVTDMKVATEQEIAAYQAEQAQAQAKQAAQAKLENNGDWQQKLGLVAQHMGLFGTAGQLVSGLASGPNAYSGRPGASWLQGWMLLQRLNGKTEGKLLPQFMQSGPVAAALDWGMQIYGMLDMGNDIRVIRDYFQHKAPPGINLDAATKLLVAQGNHPVVADAMAKMGEQLRIGENAQRMGQSGGLQMVGPTANAAVLNTELGAAQLIPKDAAYKAYAATDPVQSAGLKARAGVDIGITKGLGLLKGLIQPAMMGASALNLVSSVISVKNLVATKGASALIETNQGRGALLGAASSASFLGMYVVPMALQALKVASPAIGMASSVVNMAANVLGGVQMLNSYGLFGGEKEKNGFLDNDAFRAAFLVPPLTPIGAFAFWMKAKKKRAQEEAARLEAAQKLAVERIQQQREMAKLQLQSTGQIAGAVAGADGSIQVATNVPNDLSQLAAQLGGTGASTPAAAASTTTAPVAASTSGDGGSSQAVSAQQREQLPMVAKPMR